MRNQRLTNFIVLFWVTGTAFFFFHPFSRARDSASLIDVQITADVNRDGQVDFDSDNQGKDKWTSTRGAIFFNNNDDDGSSGEPDHADTVINGDEDLKDLAVLRIRQIPDLPKNVQVSVAVDDASSSRVHLFLAIGDYEYRILDPMGAGNIDPVLLRQADLELRIEANSYADETWNGMTRVSISVVILEGSTLLDSVQLKVAPFILLSNLNTGKTLYVKECPKLHDTFCSQLRELVTEAGAELVIVPTGELYESDIWLQDTMEIGYSEMPGRKMNVVLKANRKRPLDEYAKNELLGPDYGWIRVGSYREGYGGGEGYNRWLDWYGNLEATPPFNGYPFGRIYYGFNSKGPEEASLNPEITGMLEAQEVQAPALRLDTGWLAIKHVDEIISFVPSSDPERPYKVLVVDTEAMIALLEKWMSDGHGETSMLDLDSEEVTVSLLVRNKDLIDFNRALQTDSIEPNIDLLKQELGLREEDFIRVPSLFDEDGVALIPNMVNSTVLNGHILVASPHGPVIDGEDQLEVEIRRLLSGLPLTPHFLDARFYHQRGGEVHCATNVRREGFNTHWWKIRY